VSACGGRDGYTRSGALMLWVPKTLAGDFRKFWPVPLMVAPRRV